MHRPGQAKQITWFQETCGRTSCGWRRGNTSRPLGLISTTDTCHFVALATCLKVVCLPRPVPRKLSAASPFQLPPMGDYLWYSKSSPSLFSFSRNSTLCVICHIFETMGICQKQVPKKSCAFETRRQHCMH